MGKIGWSGRNPGLLKMEDTGSLDPVSRTISQRFVRGFPDSRTGLIMGDFLLERAVSGYAGNGGPKV